MSAPPFINSTGLISKIFEKIQQAKVPERYTTDFQGTVLGYGSGSARPFIPFLKRLGFLEGDGRPTEIYKRFRNTDSSRIAMADAMRVGYSDIFKKNEFAYNLSDDKFKNLVVELTGKKPNDSSVTAIVGSFKACKQLADFEAIPNHEEAEKPVPIDNFHALVKHQAPHIPASTDIKLAYTININLPETTNVEVYNAIFSSIKQNLIQND